MTGLRTVSGRKEEVEMRKESSLLVPAICLAVISCGSVYGWDITCTHPALTQYAEAGSELAPYCATLLIGEDGELTWDFNEWDHSRASYVKLWMSG